MKNILLIISVMLFLMVFVTVQGDANPPPDNTAFQEVESFQIETMKNVIFTQGVKEDFLYSSFIPLSFVLLAVIENTPQQELLPYTTLKGSYLGTKTNAKLYSLGVILKPERVRIRMLRQSSYKQFSITSINRIQAQIPFKKQAFVQLE